VQVPDTLLAELSLRDIAHRAPRHGPGVRGPHSPWLALSRDPYPVTVASLRAISALHAFVAPPSSPLS
jgi:hypothetical protein